MVKGPLTVTEIIAFHAGGYGFVPYGLTASPRRLQEPPSDHALLVENEHGVWDVAQRLHWDSQWAKAIGNPLAYDYGVLRVVVLPPRCRLGGRRQRSSRR